MAGKPSASASRVGRPRTRSAHQTPCIPSSKVGGPRSKSVYKSKVKDSAKKTPTKQKSVKPTPPLGQDVVVVIDPEDQEFPLPADQLPDLPLVEPEQVPNTNPQLNPANQPLDLPTEELGQPNLPQTNNRILLLKNQTRQMNKITHKSLPLSNQIKQIHLINLRTLLQSN